MNSKIWFFLCFLFLIFNLKLLNDDSYLVSYVIVEKTNELYENADELTKFLICFELQKIKKKDKLLNRLELQYNQTFSWQTIQSCMVKSRWSNDKIEDLTEIYTFYKTDLQISAQLFINCLIKSIEKSLDTTGLLKMNGDYVFYEDNVKVPAWIFIDYMINFISNWNTIDESFDLVINKKSFYDNNINVSVIEFLDYSFKSIQDYLNQTSLVKMQENQLVYEQNVNVSAKLFINYIIKSVQKNLKSNHTFKINETFIYYNAACFLSSKKDLETEKPFDGVLGLHASTYLYLQLKGRQLVYSEFSYQKYNDKTFYNNLNIRKSKVYNQKYLQNPNCVKVAAKLTTDRINCVNGCSDKVESKIGFYDYQNKNKFNLEIVMHDITRNVSNKINEDKIHMPKNETKSIKNETKTTKNETYLTNVTEIQLIENKTKTFKIFSSKIGAIENEKNLSGIVNSTILLEPQKFKTLKKCIRKCPYKFCEFETHLALQTKYNGQKAPVDHNIKIKNFIYVASYLIDDFNLQVVGLVSLFSGVSLLSILTSSVNVLSEKVKDHNHRSKYLRLIYYHKFFKIFTEKFKYVIIFFVSIFIIYKSYSLYKVYDIKIKYPNKTGYISYSSDLPSIIICFPIEKLIFPLKVLPENKINSKILKNFTFAEIIEKTNDKYKKLIRKINLVYGNRMISNKFKWKVNKTKVYFRSGRLAKLKYDYLSRCFRFELEYVNNLRYETLNPIHYLKIHFTTRWWNLFVIDQDQEFTMNLTEIKYGFSIRKVEIRNSRTEKTNCTNFKENKAFDCDSKIECITKCINEEFINRYDSLPFYSLIDKDQLKVNWSNIKFNDTKDHELEKDCIRKFEHFNDCDEVKYEETFKLTSMYDHWKIRLNLNYENYSEVEIKSSKAKLLLDILNLVSIVFGTNVIGLLTFIIKIKFFRTSLIRPFILLACLVGFSVQLYLIFNSIINEELVHSLYFRKLNNYTLPNILICFNLSKEIDVNHKLSGDYLNKISNDSQLNDVFNKILYFNITHDNKIKPNGSHFSNDEISMDTLYFLNFKCFELKLKVLFNENDLLILSDKWKVVIQLQKSFIGNSTMIYLLYRHPKSNQFR